MEFLGPSYKYRIDLADRITWVSEEWLRFAADNRAPELTQENVEGRLVWEFISGEEVRRLYELTFERVRTCRRRLVIPFRCDSPKLRRFMELTLIANQSGGIELAGELLRVELRPAVPLIDSVRHSAHGRSLSICSWCKRLQVSRDRWSEVEDAIRELGLFESVDLPALKQRVCPACMVSVYETLEDL